MDETIVGIMGILAINAALWIPLICLVNWRARNLMSDLTAELSRQSDPVLIPPERGTFRGARKRFSRIRGDGVIALTRTRLWFRPIIGSDRSFSLTEVSGIRTATIFLRGAKGFRPHLIFKTHDGDEIGYYVRDMEKWKRALHAIVGSIE